MGRKTKFKSFKDLPEQSQKSSEVTGSEILDKVAGNQSGNDGNLENLAGEQSCPWGNKHPRNNSNDGNYENSFQAGHNIQKKIPIEKELDTGNLENGSVVEEMEKMDVENETHRKTTRGFHGGWKDMHSRKKNRDFRNNSGDDNMREHSHTERDREQKKSFSEDRQINNVPEQIKKTSSHSNNCWNNKTGASGNHSNENETSEVMQEVEHRKTDRFQKNDRDRRDWQSQQSQRYHYGSEQQRYKQRTFHNNNKYGNSGSYHHNDRDNDKFPYNNDRSRNTRQSYTGKDNYNPVHNKNRNDEYKGKDDGNFDYRENQIRENYEDRGRHRAGTNWRPERNEGNSSKGNYNSSYEKRRNNEHRSKDVDNSDYRGNQSGEKYGRGDSHGGNNSRPEKNKENSNRESWLRQDKPNYYQSGGRGGRGKGWRNEQEPRVGRGPNQDFNRINTYDKSSGNHKIFEDRINNSNNNSTNDWIVENTEEVPRLDTQYSDEMWDQEDSPRNKPSSSGITFGTIPEIISPNSSHLNPNAASFTLSSINGRWCDQTVTEDKKKATELDEISLEMISQCSITRPEESFGKNEGVISRGSKLMNSSDSFERSWRTKSSSKLQEPNNYDSPRDEEYEKYKKYRQFKEIKYVRVVEVEKDLFTVDPAYSLAHCVAEDMRMGSGIAVKFCQTFKRRGELLEQNKKQGDVAVLTVPTEGSNDDRYVYYMITKRISNGKPTYETLWSSMKEMREHIKREGVKKLAIPRIGCGLDRLEWNFVKPMLEYVFRDVDIEILVCNFQQEEASSPNSRLSNSRSSYSKFKVVQDDRPITEIEPGTIIVYFTTTNGEITPAMSELQKKFPFIMEFKRTPKTPGDIVPFEYNKGDYLLYGCVVGESTDDPFGFTDFEKCLRTIHKENRKNRYEYVAFQKYDGGDSAINEKIVGVMRSILRDVDIYCCAPPKKD